MHSLEHDQAPQGPQEIPERKLTISDLAKHNCPKCYGRGYTGIDSATRKRNPCICALKTYAKVRQALVTEIAATKPPPPPPKKKGLFARIREKLRF